MNRRTLLGRIAAAATAPFASAFPVRALAAPSRTRARPGSPQWPTPAEWDALRVAVGGRLQRIEPAFAACSSSDVCTALFKDLKNPYYINQHPNVTQTLGWADAWKTEPSVYAVVANSASDVSAALKFASAHDLRVAVRGGAHSYQGTSNAPDSLLIWTHALDDITVHDAFVPQGCTNAAPAVSLGTGVIWMHAYEAVTTQHGRYVQGGGCGTVGVAGLVSGGGFGSFSKAYGTGAASLLEAEIVTADGSIRVVNGCQMPELFWALKGGGGGTFGVLTRITVRTHDLPEFFGGMFGTLKAHSDGAFQRLIERFVAFYAERLLNAHWGEQIALKGDNTLAISMVFQDLDKTQAQAAWQPFFDWVTAAPQDYAWVRPPQALAVPARHFWDSEFIDAHYAPLITHDARPGAKPGDIWWTSNTEEAGQFLHEYESLWLPASLLAPAKRAQLATALFDASRHWTVGLHCNKGLSGASSATLAAARDTATNPAVLDAFALAIIASSSDNVYPGVPGHEPDMTDARKSIEAVRAAMSTLRAIVPNGGCYVSEASYFDDDWQHKYWGAHYPRLVAIKREYDPDDLFIVHNGVGSERWSRDGFTYLE